MVCLICYADNDDMEYANMVRILKKIYNDKIETLNSYEAFILKDAVCSNDAGVDEAGFQLQIDTLERIYKKAREKEREEENV